MLDNFAYVTKSDGRFFAGVRALVSSIRRLDSEVPIVVLNAGLRREQIASLCASRCRVVSMPLTYVPRAESVKGTHYNASIFALMYLEELGFDKVVHLDADTIVFPSAIRMARLLDEYSFVGVPDHPPLSIAEHLGDADDLKLARELLNVQAPHSTVAVNAGVFGVRMSAFVPMRDVMRTAYESKLQLPRRDQTMLNLALTVVNPRCILLPVLFNFRHHFRRDPDFNWTSVKQESNGLLQPYVEDDPVAIVHYVGALKPWQDGFDKESTAFALWAQFLEGV